ncbi:ornithine cyclodeaminase family protein [Pseudotabrizicola alkalilacus]|uniref:ornithine cyclodeaminase family protein n=1 Tax=Pseudotabrizicola alkalilacus TaxID=2305252 RepID=UPI0018F1255A|nr:ornithine cyclodeaminase family protein [Pseudotabrizicola alkalilacus]
MILIHEAQSSAIVTPELAFAGCAPQNRFTIKSASNIELAGLKVGAYFPTNDARGLPRHASTILLIDQTTGRIGALIERPAFNCYRTAAADAGVLALFGTGHQAAYGARAIARIQNLSRLRVVGRNPSRTNIFVEGLRNSGLPAKSAPAETAVRAADIIICATTSTAPLFETEWVRPGTHISSMGSDSRGKQNCPVPFLRALVFSVICRSSRCASANFSMPIRTPLVRSCQAMRQGDRMKARSPLFDSSGISMQDLYMAKAILDRHTVCIDARQP